MKLHKKIIFILIILAITLSSGICNAEYLTYEKWEEDNDIQKKIVDVYTIVENKKTLITDNNIKNLVNYMYDMTTDGASEANDLKMIIVNLWTDKKFTKEQIKELYKTYEAKKGTPLWNGYDQNSTHHVAIELALKEITGESSVEIADDNEREKMQKSITKSMKSLQNLGWDSLKELDGKIKKFGNSYGTDKVWSEQWAYPVHTRIVNEFSTMKEKEKYKTAYEEAVETEEQHNTNVDINPNGGTHAVLGTTDPKAGHTIGEIIEEGKDFIGKANTSQTTLNGDNLQKASNTLYNILLTIGIFLAVAVGMYLGIKFMVASAEDKAKVKESLVPYIAGCVVIFGAFIIWKLAIMLLAKIA